MEEEALVIELHTQLNSKFVRTILIDAYAAHRLFSSSSRQTMSLVSTRGHHHIHSPLRRCHYNYPCELGTIILKLRHPSSGVEKDRDK
jgi:hypothetical protein